MEGRGWPTTTAVVLVFAIAGFALADSVRGCDGSDRTMAPATTRQTATTETNAAEGRQLDAPDGWPTGVLDGVLTFVDSDTCLLRRIGLTPGRERPVQPFRTDCEGLWAPRLGARVAFMLVPGDGSFLRLADLSQGDRDYGVYPVLAGDGAVWSFDGQRAAWCDDLATGAEREILGDVRRLRFCPLAYTLDGELAHGVGNDLVAGRRTVVTAAGPVAFAQFGTDGSVVVRVGRALERHIGHTPVVTVELPGFWVGADPVPSPDTCFAAVPVDNGISVVSLCSANPTVILEGHAATWSPDGEWLAVAEREEIVFYRVADPSQVLRWPAHAAQLAWSAG